MGVHSHAVYRVSPDRDASTPLPARVEITDLWAAYEDTVALREVTFSLSAGRVYGLVGPNGAGKSTLMRCLAGLHPPLRGSVRIEGGDVAMMSDHPPAWERLSAREQLVYVARIDRVPEEQIDGRVDAWLARVGLSAHRDHPVRALSLGQRQRLGLAQVMLREAPLVMLDEPANGMDPDARAMLAEVLREVAAGGATVLVSSHVLTELDAFCDAFVVLAGGRMVGHGTAQELHGAEAGTLTVAVTLLGDAAAQRRVIEASVTRVDGARLSRVDGNGLWVQVSDDPVAQAALLRALVDAGLPVVSFTPERPQIASLYGQLARRT